MQIMSYTAFRVNLASVLDKVNDDHVPVVIIRQNDCKAVLISYDDYLSYVETAYLLSNPYNAERINQSIADIETGRVEAHELIEE